MRTRKWAGVAGLAALAMIGSIAARADTVVVRYGQIANSARSYSSLGLYVAQRKGFLTREGVDLRVVKLPGLATMVEALDKHEVELAHTATPFLVQAVLKGSDAVAVIGAPASAIHTLVAKPDIKSFADLKGKTIGLSTPQDTLSIGARLLMAKAGLKESDFNVSVMQGSNMRLDCMTKGPCSAAPLTQPEDFATLAKGYTRLGDTSEVLPPLQFSVIAASRGWAATHEAEIVKVASAFADAYRFARDPAHRAEVAAIMTETMDIPAPIAFDMLKLYFEPDRGVMPKAAEISLEGVANSIKLLGETGELKAPLPAAAQFIDTRYLAAAGVK